MVEDQRDPRKSITIREVAARAGVSRSLVSLVLRESPHVHPDKREAVKAAMAELGYRRNRLASRLASRRTSSVGLLIQDLRNPVWADVSDGVEEVCARGGNQVVIATSGADAHRERSALEHLLELQVDGVILAGYCDIDSLADQLQGTSAALLTRRVDLPGVDCVLGDDFLGGSLATRHLIDQGLHDIVHVTSTQALPDTSRRDGYIFAMTERGLRPRVLDVAPGVAGGRRAAENLVRERSNGPVGIFAYTDVSAFGILTELESQGVQVPSEMAIVGYDDVEASGYAQISLTSVDQHIRSIGTRGTELLLQRLEKPGLRSQRSVLEPTLTVRRSSQPNI